VGFFEKPYIRCNGIENNKSLFIYLFLFYFKIHYKERTKQTKCQKAQVKNNNNQRSSWTYNNRVVIAFELSSKGKHNGVIVVGN